MRIGAWSVAAVLLVLGTSCAHHDGVDSRVTDARKAQESARDKAFETHDDPPFQAQTHVAAGRLAESQNDPNRAVEQYWKAIKVDPRNRDALFRLGVLYVQLKHYPDAVVAWKLYLKATDNDPTAYSNLGFCYELAGSGSEADAAYRAGIAKDARNVACRVNYGLMLARDNRTNEATLQLQAVLTPAEVHYNLASVLEQIGRKPQARAEYRKALELDPEMADAQTRLAAID